MISTNQFTTGSQTQRAAEHSVRWSLDPKCLVSTPEELAYHESVRAIEMQARSLDELRSRTGLLLAAASVVSSFLGAAALRSSNLDALTSLALLSFVAVLGLSMAILLPRRAWRFAIGASILLEDWTGERACGDEAAMHAHVARTIEQNWKANKDRIDDMLVLFQVAAGALGAEVIFWTLELVQRG
jgi:hypothetical protein